MAMQPLVAADNSDLWKRANQCLSESEHGDRTALNRMRDVIEEGLNTAAYLHDADAYISALMRGAVTPEYVDVLADRMKRRRSKIRT